MKTFSQIDIDFVKEYLHIDWAEDDIQLEVFLDSAKDYVKSIPEEFETVEDLTAYLDAKKISVIILLKVVSDFYSNRAATTKVEYDPLYQDMIKQIRGYTI
jgi:hypothetical protein